MIPIGAKVRVSTHRWGPLQHGREGIVTENDRNRKGGILQYCVKFSQYEWNTYAHEDLEDLSVKNYHIDQEPMEEEECL